MPRRVEKKLVYVRSGIFSGSAISLRRALMTHVSAIDFDLLSLARKPSLIPARGKAVLEARWAGRGISWARTAAWSVACQRAFEKAGLLADSTPIVFVQTLPAFVLEPRVKYVIYTDRVAREGAAVGGPFASRFTAGWLEREAAFLRGAHRVYVMGPSSKAVLTGNYGIPDSKIAVVGAGPNVSVGAPVESRSCRRLLFVGTDWKLKGGPELLSAFEKVRRDHSSLELLLVGSRPTGPLPEGVGAVGRVPHAQMDALYSLADALVIPTHMEAFGISLMEGLMKGLPCIGTTIGNQAWIIGEAGKCVEPGNVDVLSGAITELLTNYPEYQRRARERGEELRQMFRWENVASTILEGLL